MIRSYPDAESLSDCAACESVQPEVGFEQYGQTLTVLEASVTRESSMPMVARTLWNSTTLQAYLAAAGSEVTLLQMQDAAHSCVVLGCAGLCCAVLCCAVLCVLCRAVP